MPEPRTENRGQEVVIANASHRAGIEAIELDVLSFEHVVRHNQKKSG